MKRLRILTLCSVIMALAISYSKKMNPTTTPEGEGLVIKKEWLITNPNPITPKEYIRPADQTFLTFPEWYLVFSPDEQALFLKNHTSSSFPYIKHIKQFWQSYKIINAQIKDNFPYNRGYHVMIWVIGVSTTVEYALKSLYENTVGRLTDTHDVLTDEDKFNATYTQDYVDFIKDRPWYEFDFKKRLGSLWAMPFSGSHFFRKIERRYFLSSELLAKFIYGKLIGLGTKTVYDEALPTTEVLVDSVPQNHLNLKIIQQFPDKSTLISIPRYHKFNAAICELAKNGFTFKEIAGNNSAILLTILVSNQTILSLKNTQTVFTQPIASDPSMKRIALAVPIKDLNVLLLQLDNDKINIEHIFDF
jgi:hypothetical protein